MEKRTYENTLKWLLEPEDIGVRCLALRDLVQADEKVLRAAREQSHREGPIAQILARMHPEGYWDQPGAGYYPKYTGTAWSVIMLSQLGASVEMDERIEKACSYLLGNSLTKGGQFSVSGAPSGTADCMQGNYCAAFLDLGYTDPRLEKAFEWMARSVTAEGIAPLDDKTAPVRYYSGKCGPNFACGSNNKLPCAWGAAKVMLAFSKLPRNQRTPIIDRAIRTGVDFLFSTDPAKPDYPSGYSSKPSGNWWKFGFPVFYITDILQIIEALVGLGYENDPRLAHAISLIQDKQDSDGRWPLEYEYTGKTWVNCGARNQPNKWVTLRVLRVLRLTS